MVGAFSSFLNLAGTCDLLCPVECGKNVSVPVLSSGPRGTVCGFPPTPHVPLPGRARWTVAIMCRKAWLPSHGEPGLQLDPLPKRVPVSATPAACLHDPQLTTDPRASPTIQSS